MKSSVDLKSAVRGAVDAGRERREPVVARRGVRDAARGARAGHAAAAARTRAPPAPRAGRAPARRSAREAAQEELRGAPRRRRPLLSPLRGNTLPTPRRTKLYYAPTLVPAFLCVEAEVQVD